MPKWWPWGRSAPAESKPAAAAAPPPEPSWQRLPAVQRTVGDLDTTAQLAGFTASLTTSQDPRLTGTLDLLAAGGADRMAVLGGVDDATAGAPPPPAAPAAPAPRTWGPSPTAVQRAIRGASAVPAQHAADATVQRTAEAPVQRAAEATLPVRHLHPLAAVESTDGAPHSMTEAPPPDDRRPLAVAGVPDAAGIAAVDEPRPVDPIAPPSAPDPDDGSVDSAAEGTALPVVQRTTSAAIPAVPPTASAPIPAVPTTSAPMPVVPPAASAASPLASAVSAAPPVAQRTAAVPTRTAPQTPPENAGGGPAPLVRRLPVIESDTGERPSTTIGFSGSRPIPVLRIVDSTSHPVPPPAATAAATTRAAAVQRAPESASPPAAPVRTDQPAPTPDPAAAPSTEAPHPAAPPPADAVPVVAQHTEVPPDIADHVALQRLPVNVPRDEPAAPGPVRQPVAPPTGSPLARLQRLPVVDPQPPAPATGSGSPHQNVPAPMVQRLPGLPADPAADIADHGVDAPTVPEWTPAATAAEPEWEPPMPGPAVPTTGGRVAPTSGPHTAARPDVGRSPALALPPPAAGVVQRMTLPVVASAGAPRSDQIHIESPAPHRHSQTAAIAPVQRAAATGGRLVVLPPVRTDTGTGGPAHQDVSAGEPTRSVLFESPRPVGLQRMFEHTATRRDTAPGATFASSGPALGGVHRVEFGDEPAGTTGPSYDPGSNTLTFAAPVVQRQADSAPPPPEPEPAPTPAPAAAAAPAAAPPTAGGNIDELVNRLYDPLAARLRAELWLDRERAGVLMELGR